jgi:hypothetical protein
LLLNSVHYIIYVQSLLFLGPRRSQGEGQGDSDERFESFGIPRDDDLQTADGPAQSADTISSPVVRSCPGRAATGWCSGVSDRWCALWLQLGR